RLEHVQTRLAISRSGEHRSRYVLAAVQHIGADHEHRRTRPLAGQLRRQLRRLGQRQFRRHRHHDYRRQPGRQPRKFLIFHACEVFAHFDNPPVHVLIVVRMHRLCGLLTFLCAGTLFAAAPPEPALPQAKAAMARLPLRFEENRGQWDASVRFTARSNGANLQLTAHGPAFLVGSSRVEIGLVHASPSPVIQPLDPLPATTNYMVGARSQWHTGIANYARVRYQSVYPGIDVVYYGNQNQLEYDFVLAPGANPDAIRVNFRGDVQVSLTPDGDLALDSGGAQVLQKAPIIYQDNRPIKGRYTLLAHNQAGFRLDRYDRTRSLVIDPILVYCAYIGSSGADSATVMNGFVATIDPSLYGGDSLTYSTYLGGTDGLSSVNGMALDPAGFIYLIGTTKATDCPLTTSVYAQALFGSQDAFLTKLDRNSTSLVYSTYLGGGLTDEGRSIAVGSDGKVYFGITTTSTDFPLEGPSYRQNLQGGVGIVVGMMDMTQSGEASLVYSTYFGGSDQNHPADVDEVRKIALDAKNNVILTGYT